nr:MAG TPA_asm: hypothetical protein [Caudoviricetes sp.]
MINQIRALTCATPDMCRSMTYRTQHTPARKSAGNPTMN